MNLLTSSSTPCLGCDQAGQLTPGSSQPNRVVDFCATRWQQSATRTKKKKKVEQLGRLFCRRESARNSGYDRRPWVDSELPLRDRAVWLSEPQAISAIRGPGNPRSIRAACNEQQRRGMARKQQPLSGSTQGFKFLQKWMVSRVRVNFGICS